MYKIFLAIIIFLTFNCSFVSPSISETKRWNNEGLDELCAMGMPAACHNFAISYARGDGVDLNEKKAGTYYILACKMGYGPSCNNLGVQYYYGIGQKLNLKTSQSYFKKSCAFGDKIGCSNINLSNNSLDVQNEGRDCSKDEYWSCSNYKNPINSED